jgi:hypothetical protein
MTWSARTFHSTTRIDSIDSHNRSRGDNDVAPQYGQLFYFTTIPGKPIYWSL